MKFELKSRGISITPELRAHAAKRMVFALGRFERIKAFSVLLADVNGPRGGRDKTCDVKVDTGGGKPVVVRERHHNIFAAVALAAGRAGLAVQRKLEASRDARFLSRLSPLKASW